ncbi:MAG: lipopolysaccharide heptosyltransferase II, partial [Candidatus Latescibacterota bacterium]
MNSRRMIALIAPNWLGDAVMSLPLVGLIGASERAGLSVVAPPSTARVYWRLPGVDELAVLPKRDATRGVRNRAKFLGRARPDAAVILPPSFSSAVGPWLARVPVRVGYRGDGRGGLLTDSLENRDGRKVHLSLGYLKLGEAALDRLGLAAPDGTDPPAVRVGDADHAELEELLDVGALGRYAVLVPGATYGPAKSWPWERYREVARALASDIAVVLAGTPGERDVCDRIVDGVNGAHNLAGRTSLGAFLSLLSRASVVVANDSGSPHLAASMGTPVVVIFGSTS